LRWNFPYSNCDGISLKFVGLNLTRYNWKYANKDAFACPNQTYQIRVVLVKGVPVNVLDMRGVRNHMGLTIVEGY